MHDIKFIRDQFQAFTAGMARRPLSEDQHAQIASLLDLDEALRAATTEKQEAEAARNASSKEIGKAKAAKDEARAAELMAAVAAAKETIERAGTRLEALESQRFDVLAGLPNVPALDVPDGADEDSNVEMRRWYKKDGADAPPVELSADHVTIGEGLGLMGFEAAARISGARFVALKGGLARMERALAAFMLDIHTGEKGYSEVSPPLLVKDEAMFGTSQLPKFKDDLFRVDPDFWLVPTAEVSLTNLVREQILDESALPIRMTADTPCFRSEAGSAGRDTRGIIRQHQFRKVELVSITTPEQSEAEHERMTACAEDILKRLELPYRVMLLCAGDMGFAAKKTYDLEVWLPSQGKYREISSCSNCGDFQARRMNARFRNSSSDRKVEFVHTLNGSGLAVGRTLVSILENYQNADGTVRVPEALIPYMGGVEVLRA